MAFLVFVTGVLGFLVGSAVPVFRCVRDVETMMPDHDVTKA